MCVYIFKICAMRQPGNCQKLKRIWMDTQSGHVLLYTSDCNIQELWSNGIDRYSTPLSPLFHSILMEWCVYKHQVWYPLYRKTNSTFLIVFTECYEVLRLWVIFASLQQYATSSEKRFWFVGCTNWNSKRVWIPGLRGDWLQTTQNNLKAPV